MPQVVRPIADEESGGGIDPWTASLPWWSKVDEATPDDSDFAFSTADGSMQVRLGHMFDPGVHTGHTCEVRTRRSTSANGVLDLVTATGAVIRLDNALPFTSSWTTRTYNLSAGQAANINTYEELYVKIFGGDGCEVSWIEFTAPDALPVNGASVEVHEMVETANGQLVQGASAVDFHEMIESAAGIMTPGRLVDRSRKFRMQRVIVDFGASQVLITGRGR